MSSNHKPVLSGFFVIFVLSCLGLIIYSNTLDSSFHFDDENSIVDNLNIRDLTELRVVWNYWPTRFITYLSLALNYHFNQLNVFNYHLFNLAVHLVSAVLVWWLVLLTFSTPVMREQKIASQANLIACLAGLIFVTHPLQTQAVTYIVQRTTSLATLFYLVALTLYAKSRLLPLQRHSLGFKRTCYIGSLMTAVAAMFTKEMTITLPLMILLYEACFLKTERRINWKQIIPFLAILPIIPLTMFLTKTVNFYELRRTIEPPSGISVQHYLLTQFKVVFTYLRLLFIPWNQNLDYDYPISKSLFELPTVLSLLFFVVVIIIAIRIFSRYRLISFAIFGFFLSLLPESSIIPIKDVIYEHRLYLPMAGFSLFLVSAMYYLLGKNNIKLMTFMLVAIVICYSILTYNRNSVWKDEFTLWNDTVHKSPQKARPYNNRGLAYQAKGNFEQALIDYNRAIEIDHKLPRAYTNRGSIYLNKGEFSRAISDFNKAIEINPNFAEAYNNRGLLHQYQGNFKEALSDFNKAIEIKPNLAYVYYNRGLTYQTKNDFQQALRDYNKTIKIDSRHADAYYNRGLLYQKVGNFSQAISDYNKAIEIDRKLVEAYNNRAIAYFSIKEYHKSWEDVHKVEALGYKVDPKFLEELKEASGR